jgi:hypothetical protein
MFNIIICQKCNISLPSYPIFIYAPFQKNLIQLFKYTILLSVDRLYIYCGLILGNNYYCLILGNNYSNGSIRSGLSMQDELRSVLDLLPSDDKPLEIKITPDVYITHRSSPNEIKKWLRAKDFSKRLIPLH